MCTVVCVINSPNPHELKALNGSSASVVIQVKIHLDIWYFS